MKVVNYQVFIAKFNLDNKVFKNDINGLSYVDKI